MTSKKISPAILSEIQLKINFILMGIKNKNDHIKQYCTSLRNDVQLTADEIFKQVNDQKLKLMQQIDEFECETMKSTEKIEPNEFDIKELESFYSKWSEKKPNYEINDADVIEIIKMKKKADNQSLKLESIIYNERILKFERNTNKVQQSILGTLERHVETNTEVESISGENIATDNNVNDKSILIEGTFNEESSENDANISRISLDIDEIELKQENKSSEQISIKFEDLHIIQKLKSKQVITKGAAKRTSQTKKEILQNKTNQEIKNENDQESNAPSRYSMRLRRAGSFGAQASSTLTLPNENKETTSLVKLKRTRSKQKTLTKQTSTESDIIWL
jgi:hypothetical protein